jgi:general secretion pathway protein L
MAEQTLNDQDGGYSVTTGSQFFAWWKTHLWQCLPSSIRNAIIRNRRPFTISPADDKLWTERSDWSRALKISQTTLLSGDASTTRPVALLVGEANGLRRVVDLPLAVEARLDPVLAYELDRLTPLRAQDIYYDFRVVGRSVSRNTCTVELVAAPRARVDATIAQARVMGADVQRVSLNADDIDHGIDLLRTRGDVGDRAADSSRWITPTLAALCGLLALALVVYPIYQKRQHVIALLPIEASARTEAEAASVVQRQLERQVSEYNHVLKRKHASPIAVQVLEDLGKRLPDDTWAQTFEIKLVAGAAPATHTREVIVQGETGSGGKLLQMVQESTLLKDPVLKAAMTRVSPAAERFHFAGELVSVAPPPGLSLADATSTLSTPVQVTPNAAAGAPALSAPPAVGSASEKAGDKKPAEPTKPANEPVKTQPTPSSEKQSLLTPNSNGTTGGLYKRSNASVSMVEPLFNGANVPIVVVPSGGIA